MGHSTLSCLLVTAALLAVGCDTSVQLDSEPAGSNTSASASADDDSQAATEPSADEAAPTPSTNDQSAAVDEPEQERVPMDRPVRSNDPPRGYLGAVASGYRSAQERIESIPVQQAIQHYKALHGEYPQSHEEFMEKCWKPLQTPLPEIEEGYEYRYDPEAAALFKVPIDAE